ncbi:MAG: polyhydroxyalkanoic acid system family protein [Polyangiaceae bacterium]|nr:polyhydroxyalkanoic acid system family protein [Polyangiaceae bacterium]
MKHEVSHGLPMSLAKVAVNKAFEAYSVRFAEYKPVLTWTSDRKAKAGFSVKGFTLNGGFELREGVIVMELDVPFILRVFSKQAFEAIEKEVRIWIGKAKSGELGSG